MACRRSAVRSRLAPPAFACHAREGIAPKRKAAKTAGAAADRSTAFKKYMKARAVRGAAAASADAVFIRSKGASILRQPC